MDSKIYSSIIASVLIAGFLVLSLVSAIDLVQVNKGGSFTRNSNVSNFVLNNIYTGNVNIVMSYPTLQVSDGKGHLATLTLNPSSLSLNNFPAGNSTIINASIAVDSNFLVNPRTYTFPAITISSADSSSPSVIDSDNITFAYTQSYCKYGNLGGLDITRLTDNKLDNKNAWQWSLSDNIEITVRVTNSQGSDLDILLDYGLYDTTSNKFVDIDSDSISLSVNDGRSKEATIKFQVPSSSDDINPDHTFKFYVKSYEEGNEKKICTERAADEDVLIKQESNSVTLTSINLQTTATCGDNLELSSKVNNNGKNDQKRVLVRAYNQALGLDARKSFSDFNSGDSQSLVFPFSIPQNATDKTYQISLFTYFRYDSSNSGCNGDTNIECYDKNSADDLSKTYNLNLAVSGCKPAVLLDNAQITASLETATQAGKDIIVKATIKNIGTTSNSYTILTSGTEAFATLGSITPQTLVLGAGASQDVLITLKANSDSSGDYTFKIRAVSNGQIKDQPLSLTIEPKTSFLPSNLLSSLKGNWFIWVVVLVNVILIVLIIVVAVRIAKG